MKYLSSTVVLPSVPAIVLRVICMLLSCAAVSTPKASFAYSPRALLVRLWAPFTLPTVRATVNVISPKYIKVTVQSA